MRIILLIFLIWLGGFGYFVTTVKNTSQDLSTVVDGIVVLTGGQGRIAEGMKLYQQKLGRNLFISGVYKGVDARELARKQELSKEAEILLKDEHLGYKALNTIQNAEEILDWIQKNNIHTIRLVTADYHLQRSIQELRKLIPSLEIIGHPIYVTSQLDHIAFRRLWREYIKLTVRVISLNFVTE